MKTALASEFKEEITPKTLPSILASWVLLDIKECIDLIREEFGISSPLPVQTQSVILVEEPIEEQTEFDVTLEKVGPQKLEVIKVVRSLTSLGLKESKELVDSALNLPTSLLKGVSKAIAEEAISKLKVVGAVTSIH